MIPLTEPVLDGNELHYLADCIQTGWVSSRGAYVSRFEAAFADWCRCRHGVATSSGTAALHLALLALDVGPGDEVLVPALSYVASANAIAYTGARPVFVDVDPTTWNIDPDEAERQITPRTRAIMPVHLYGHAADMRRVIELAAAHDLRVVEDACQAHGAEYGGRRVGGIGHIGCFSFFGNKLITTGEGGMVVTDDDELAARTRLLANQAASPGYRHCAIGFSYRMTNLQAAVGLAQFERAGEFIAARRRTAALYDAMLAGMPGITRRREPAWSAGVCWLYSVLVDPTGSLSRDELIAHFAAHGIETKPFFHPLPGLPPYADPRPYPAAEYVAAAGISLPTYARLRCEQIAQVIDVLRSALAPAAASGVGACASA